MEFDEPCVHEHCTARFKNKNNLHESMHTAVRSTPFKHKCPRCPKAFKTLTDLQNHRVSCNAVIHSCYKCGERIGSIYEVKHHCKTVQACRPTEQALDRYVALKWKPLQCPSCCEVFPNDEQLFEHKITHKPESTFPCGHCSMLFVSQALRSEHISDDRNHFNRNCSDCGRRFSDKKEYKMHKFFHKDLTETQDYEGKCSHCRDFFTREKFRIHAKYVLHYDVYRVVPNNI